MYFMRSVILITIKGYGLQTKNNWCGRVSLVTYRLSQRKVILKSKHFSDNSQNNPEWPTDRQCTEILMLNGGILSLRLMKNY